MSSSTNKAVPEKRLLIACARTRMTAGATKLAREIAAGPMDWDFLLRAAAENSVIPLLALHLPKIAGDIFLPEQLEQLRAAARAAGIRALRLSAELIRVVGALRAEKILALPYKGPVIAVQAYGDLALREFEDLDIIVPQEAMGRANEVLRGLNYKPRYPWVFEPSALVPGEYNYFEAERRVMVELHTEKTLRHFPVAPILSEMNKSAVNVSLGGHDVRTFSIEDTLVLLCVHGTKDFWERISWLADVSELVQRQTALDWDSVWRRAEKLRAGRMLSLGLLLAVKALDAPLPGEILARVAADSTAAAIANEIAGRLIARALPARTAAESFRYRRQMVTGTLSSWKYGLRLATAPAEEDWMMLRLPRALSPLYAVLRPFRLFRKYGASQEAKVPADSSLQAK
jgi:hypothetical protein